MLSELCGLSKNLKNRCRFRWLGAVTPLGGLIKLSG
jgi:hypothetical protein